MMGIEPRASENLISTCPRLHTEQHWVSISNVPFFAGTVSVQHVSPIKTKFYSESTKPFTWRATFRGNYSQIIINSNTKKANHFMDALHNVHSYVDITIKGNEEMIAKVK